MKNKVIFDTNFILDHEPYNFLGNRKSLKLFSESAEIIIPTVVIEEIKRKKKKRLTEHYEEFPKNHFYNLLNINEASFDFFSVEYHIQKLYDEEDIPFSALALKDENRDTLEKITELALQKKPPFEPKENTDKGFKDTLIYFSILEYLEENKDKNIYVCTGDGQLTIALKEHPELTVIKSYTEFQSNIIDDYTVEKISEKLDIPIAKENIIHFWSNINKNQTFLIEKDGIEYVVEEESGEMQDSCEKAEFQEEIAIFISADESRMVLEGVLDLYFYTHYLSDDEVLKILGAAYENETIRLQINEPDVREFIYSLYVNKKELLIRENKEAADFLQKTFNE